MKAVPPNPPEAVLEDLKKFTNYTIRVYAFTSNGNGVSSEAVTLSTQEDGEFITENKTNLPSFSMSAPRA